LSTKQVPGFVRRIKLRSGRKNDLHRMMRIFRAEAEARLLQRAQKYPRHCPTAGVSRLGRSK
jgi:hypothetical protein